MSELDLNLTDHDRLVQTHTIVQRLDKAIMGNGQPGLLQDVAVLKQDMEERKEEARQLRVVAENAKVVADAVPSKKRTAFNTGAIAMVVSTVLAVAQELVRK